MKKTPNPVFEPIDVAAKRLKRNVGHLRKLCLQQWSKLGLARLEKRDFKKTWFVRSDATVPERRKSHRSPGQNLINKLTRQALKKYPIQPVPTIDPEQLKRREIRRFAADLGILLGDDLREVNEATTVIANAAPTIVIHVAAGATLNITSAGVSGNNPATEGQK